MTRRAVWFRILRNLFKRRGRINFMNTKASGKSSAATPATKGAPSTSERFVTTRSGKQVRVVNKTAEAQGLGFQIFGLPNPFKKK